MDKQWMCARIYYYETEKDHLIAECVAPLVRVLAAQGIECQSIERHWRNGPHLACYFRVAAPSDSALENQIRAAVHSFLTEHPSRRIVTESEARATHESLSRYEARLGPFVTLKPDNSIEFSTESPALEGYPSVPAAALACKLAGDLLPLVLDTVVTTCGNQAERRTAVIKILLTYAQQLGPLKLSYFFMRAYVEKVIALPPNDPATVRARLHNLYEDRREVMHQLICDFDTSEKSPLEQRWSAAIGDMWHQAQAAVSRGERLTLGNNQADGVYDKAGWQVDAELSSTPFLARWRDNKAAWEKFDTSPFYQAHMFCVNQVYRIVQLLGISAQEKLVVFSLLSSSIENAFEINPMERIEHS